MDSDAQKRLERLESLVRETIDAVNALRTDLADFREEQRAENAKTRTFMQLPDPRSESVKPRFLLR